MDGLFGAQLAQDVAPLDAGESVQDRQDTPRLPRLLWRSHQLFSSQRQLRDTPVLLGEGIGFPVRLEGSDGDDLTQWTGVYVLLTSCSCKTRAMIDSAPNTSCIGKMRSSLPIC